MAESARQRRIARRADCSSFSSFEQLVLIYRALDDARKDDCLRVIRRLWRRRTELLAEREVLRERLAKLEGSLRAGAMELYGVETLGAAAVRGFSRGVLRRAGLEVDDE